MFIPYAYFDSNKYDNTLFYLKKGIGMKIKSKSGFIGTDMAIAIVAIMAFSGLIFSLMYYHYLENVKLRRSALATIYLTETMEQIGIAGYESVTQEDIEDFIPSDLNDSERPYTITVIVEELEDADEDIIKKVAATISYQVGESKIYQKTIERIKIKE